MSYKPKTITIYSVGLIGGSLGLALKRSGYTGTIIGLSSPASTKTALFMGSIDEGHGYDALAQVIGRTDLLILCSPISVILDTLKKLDGIDLPAGLVITDVGSTKREIVEAAARALPKKVTFIGGHPMAGSEKQGAAAADPFLFQNAVYALTPTDPTSELCIGFSAFLSQHTGCKTLMLTPLIHDTMVATVSHVPHVLAVALVNLAAETEASLPCTLKLAAGGFRDMTRIASSPYPLWHDILSTNKDAVASLLDRYAILINEYKTDLLENGLKAPFDAAASTRSQIPFSNKGFISQVYDILVIAPDQPGAIATMATLLADKNINIKDIEVLKVREGEGGTIRLGFETHEAASAAAALLSSHGFAARER